MVHSNGLKGLTMAHFEKIKISVDKFDSKFTNSNASIYIVNSTKY